MRAEVRVTGIVQGVGFRPFVYRAAVRNGLVGYVRNRGDAGVEIVVEGGKGDVERFLEDVTERGPPLAQIHRLTTTYAEDRNEFVGFRILDSSDEVELSGSVVPADVSICDDCLRELRDPSDRRHGYFFITCTNCGPRYTAIERLPYDRPNTTMRDFPMCDPCLREYRDPSNRRFHAQTVACSRCGPRAYLMTSEGQPVECRDPIREAGRLLGEGRLVAVKGNGGFHVAAAATQDEPIGRLRRTKHRAQKPLAIMARDLEAVRSFAEVSPEEASLLTSRIRPIVLLRKSGEYYLSGLVSPGLHNVGVMLPYTGLHVMLFDGVREPAYVMTSANPPSEPIVTENREALERLGSVVNYLLLHDRAIAHRCDDSVVRLHGDRPSIIRRSRGYAPQPVRLRLPAGRCALGVGAELNATSCVALGDRAFLSQHIGDVEELETLRFLRESIDHLTRLTNSRAEVVACDLHPGFNTTRLAQSLAEGLGCPVVPVQHHHAHIASLMAEHGIPEMVGIACDGFGYGPGGEAWGGEVLHCSREGFRRLGHLQEQPMAGGDLATRYPLRMAAGILHGAADIGEWLLSHSHRFPHGEREVETVLRQLERRSAPTTTSCGRVLDAVSALLGVCYERTYEGEPAMKLESAALGGRDTLNLAPQIRGRVIQTTCLVREVFDQRGKQPVADLACSAESYIARSLAQLAVEEARRECVAVIGISGGVAHNEHITLTIRKATEGAGLGFLVHEQVPPGDGGISLGQAIVASNLTK